MKEFTFAAPASRVVFGAGALEKVPEEIERLGASRALLVASGSGRRAVETLTARLGDRCAGAFEAAVQHVPIETARAARAEAAERRADVLVAIGGGSAVGVAKAVALETGLPIVAVPTTYSGSEMTPIYGITSDGRKRTGRDARVQPRTVVYDPLLTLGLPPSVSGPSGMNGIAHAVEALYAAGANPITSLLAEEAIGTLARSLPVVVDDPGDLEGRSDALYGACLAGYVLAIAGTAIHHRICHVLGGSYGLAHAETHAVVLPYVVAYNSAAAADAVARVGRTLGGTSDPAGALQDLGRRLRAPQSLAALGLSESSLDEAARLSAESPPANPRPVDAASLRQLLDDAYHGRRPRTARGAP